MDVVEAKALVLEKARERVVALEGTLPQRLHDLAALLILASDGETACAVRLIRMGFPYFQFSSEKKIALFALGGRLFSADSAVPPLWAYLQVAAPTQAREIGRLVLDRVQELWSTWEKRQKALLEEAERLGREVQPKLGAGLSLEEHQLTGLVLLRRLRYNALLLDDMGLGKTITALIAVLLTNTWPLLIVCPTSAVYNWSLEAKKWLAYKDPAISMVESNDIDPAAEVVVCSWARLARMGRKVALRGFRFVIGDESHYMMNLEAQRTRAFFLARHAARHKLLLTGTLMPNGRSLEAYPQIFAIDRDKAGKLRDYKREFCDPQVFHTRGGGMGLSYGGRSNDELLAEKIYSIAVRRTRAEVPTDALPPMARYAVHVRVSAEWNKKIEAERLALKRKIADRAAQVETETLAAGRGLEEARKKSEQVLGSEVVTLAGRLRVLVGLAKTDAASDLVKDLLEEGHRPVVFCWHQEVFDHAVDTFSLLVEPGEVLWAGGESNQRTRGQILESWQAGTGRVLVLSSAFAEAVTLTSSSRGIMLERWWNPGKEMQAEKRLHRKTQENPVAWHYMIAPGTVDDVVGELITWKETGIAQQAGQLQTRLMEWISR